ncbi:MAG: terminase small subunit [Clostridiales bacterium]|nr:terminase small subunit [Clostridiales bacterium]
MTEKQKKFADEYLIDLNATRAYKAAYKSVKNDNSAMAGASRMLRNVKVATYIEEKMAERAERTEIKQDDVVKELAKIGFAQITDYVEVQNINGFEKVIIKPTDEIEKEKIGAIAGIKEGRNGIEIKMNDKVKALELLGKHLGMFTEKQEIKAQISYEDYLSKLDGDYSY